MKAVFGPGKYYLGDICYVMADEIYKGVWGGDHNYEDGWFPIWKDTPGSQRFAVSRTAYGDGEYFDNLGRSYPVDAGVIGIVPELLWKSGVDPTKCGIVLEIKDKLIFEAEGGIFTVTADNEQFTIDTKNQPELDEEGESLGYDEEETYEDDDEYHQEDDW